MELTTYTLARLANDRLYEKFSAHSARNLIIIVFITIRLISMHAKIISGSVEWNDEYVVLILQ